MSEELFERVPRLHVTDSVVARIQELIFENRLRAGDMLPPERELAAQFNVSRNVLREAFRVLAQQGFITVRPGKGTIVAEPSADIMRDSLQVLLRLRHVSLTELCDARMLIEPQLAGRAAERAATSDLTRLTMWVERLRASADSPADHVNADLGFHDEIAELAQHAVFSTIVAAVHEPVTWSMTSGTKVPKAIRHSDEQHEAIYQAIMAGDADSAHRAMSEHIKYVLSYVVEHDLTINSTQPNARA